VDREYYINDHTTGVYPSQEMAVGRMTNGVLDNPVWYKKILLANYQVRQLREIEMNPGTRRAK
jgi:hypothetical protein